ncbi:MAG: retroviral-like aspartic protease family protein [Odoribacter sp.]|nr:retroviral-like aspartic protease family protein [Odoribacter sp.]
MNGFKIKYVFFLFCLCMGSANAFSQATGYYEEIPFEWERNKIIVQVTVEGVKGRYIFDTGASMCITHSRMEKCGDKHFSEQTVTDAHGKEASFREVVMESVKLGSVDFRNVPALVLGKGHLLECYGVDGIIGSSLFPASVIRIDVARKILTLTDGTARLGLNPRTVMPLMLDRQNIPYIVLNLGEGQEEKVMFDTGAPAFYEMNEPTYQALKSRTLMKTTSTGFGILGMGIGGLEKAMVKYRLELAEVRIGMGKFKRVTVETMNGPGSRIGAGLLEYGVVTLDYPGNKFYFEPFNATPVDLSRKEWNVAITVSGDSLVIGCVWESMRDELKSGERVVAVNGQRVGSIDPCTALTSSVIKMEGEEATISVVDEQGMEKEVVIRKE